VWVSQAGGRDAGGSQSRHPSVPGQLRSGVWAEVATITANESSCQEELLPTTQLARLRRGPGYVLTKRWNQTQQTTRRWGKRCLE
jgi:hypothetical protein